MPIPMQAHLPLSVQRRSPTVAQHAEAMCDLMLDGLEIENVMKELHQIMEMEHVG